MGKVLKKGSLSYQILDLLEKSVDGYVRLEDFTYNTWAYAKGYDRPLSKTALSKALSRLKSNGFIESSKLDGKIIYKLINSPIELLMEDKQIWDQKWRIVIFDIPEQKRMIRDLFRRNLKKWGFVQLQKSVWISQKSVYAKLEKYIEALKITKYVTIIEANKISQYSHK